LRSGGAALAWRGRGACVGAGGIPAGARNNCAPKSNLAVGNFTRIRQLRNFDSAPGELNQIFDEFKIFDQVFIQ
jgi:hypothetical protein